MPGNIHIGTHSKGMAIQFSGSGHKTHLSHKIHHFSITEPSWPHPPSHGKTTTLDDTSSTTDNPHSGFE